MEEYIKAGKIDSFRSCAVSTSILNGPFGVKTAIKSKMKMGRI